MNGAILVIPVHSPSFPVHQQDIQSVGLYNSAPSSRVCTLLQFDFQPKECPSKAIFEGTKLENQSVKFGIAFYPNSIALQSLLTKVCLLQL